MWRPPCSQRNFYVVFLVLVQRTFTAVTSAAQLQDQPAASSVLELRYRFEEERPVGTIVGNVARDANLAQIYDAAALRQLTFRFLKQQPGNEFVVENATGVIRSAGRVDRETLCPASADSASCDLRLDVAVQPLPYFRIIRVTVTIVDINDNAPRFDVDSSARTIEVLESAAVGSTLMLPEAVDPDGPEFGVQLYNLIADPSSSEYFRLTSSPERRPDGTFDVRLVLTKPLDRELTDAYRLQVVAVDGGSPPRSGTVDVDVIVIDVNDNSPIFDQELYEASLPENVPPMTTFIRVHAVDYDDGPNGEVVYSLAPQSAAAHGRIFGVDNVTGDVFVRASIDYEETPIYRLMIIAKDRGSGSDSVPVSVPLTINVVDLNDNAPAITVDTLSSVAGVAEIAEDSPVRSFVAHLSVVDADSGANGRFTCTLDDRRFALAEMVGVDGEFQITTAAALDHETRTVYEPTVTCRDYGSPSSLTSTARLVVSVTDVNDNDPVFSQATYVGELIENNYIGAVLLQVNATDRDSGLNGRITYSVDGEAGGWFDVDPATGVLKAGVSFDRELTDVVRFYVVARDGGQPTPRSSSAAVTVTIVDVNDERPNFSQPGYSFAVAENRDAGIAVGSVAAFDPDGSIYGEVTYAILSGTGGVGASGADAFDIDQKTGVITTTRMLDRESVDVYHLTVVASDRGVPPLSSTASVAVYVSDENDNRPVFVFPSAANNTVHVSTRAPVGHVVTRLVASDADSGKNGKVVYFVGDDTRSEFFDVDNELGVVIVNRGLSELDGRVFSLEVIARDQGVPHHSVASTLNLVVNRSLAFVADFDGVGGHQRGGAAGFGSLVGSQNLVFVVVLAGISGAIAFALIIAIVVIRRQDRENKATHKYNCRTEALKMMSSTNINAAEVARGDPDDADAGACATLLRSRQMPPTSPGNETSRQLTSLNNVDETQQQLQQRCCQNEVSLERSGRSWPSTLDNQILQNPQACSSLLTADTTGSTANGTLSRRAQRIAANPTTVVPSDYRGCPVSRGPALPPAQSREAEVCRLLKALQQDANNETDSDHSGDGSNTDSGRGPSSVEESGEAALRARLLAGEAQTCCDPAMMLTPGDCRRAAAALQQLQDISNVGVDSPNQVVPEAASYVSNHSYSALSNPYTTPNHLSTFTSRSPTPTHPANARFYNPPGRRDPVSSGSLTDVANGNSNAYGGSIAASTLPMSADRKQVCCVSGALPAAAAGSAGAMRYASNACVDDVGSGAGRFNNPTGCSSYGRAPVSAAPGGPRTAGILSPSSPLSNRRTPAAVHMPSSLRRPGFNGFPGSGSGSGQGNGSSVRLLGNDDSMATESTTGDDVTQYSCADVSAALHDGTSPCCRRESDATSVSTVNPRQLCDEIDELFFKT